MEFFRENTIKVLKELIKNCKFAEHLLRHSAEEFEDEKLRKTFKYYADQNSDYANKLNSEIVRLGGNTEDFTEITFYDNNNKDIKEHFKACETSVNNAVRSYKDISLREDILWEVVPVIAKQYYGEKEAHETIQTLTKGA